MLFCSNGLFSGIVQFQDKHWKEEGKGHRSQLVNRKLKQRQRRRLRERERQKAIGLDLDWQTTTLLVHHAFFSTFISRRCVTRR